MLPSAAAVTASRPSSAPVGTIIWPPRSRARSIKVGCRNSAPQLSTITALPASSMGRQTFSMIAAGAHSIASSAWAGISSSATSGQSMRALSSQACALARSFTATPASVRPGTPSASRRASTRPMAPRPAMATRVMTKLRQQMALLVIRARLPCHKRARVKRYLDRTPRARNCAATSRESAMMKTVLGFGLLLATGVAASAQNFPSKPMTMVIPFAAGGPTAVLGRVVGQRMSELLGQQVIVENIGGAGGMTGSKRVADAQPDGYNYVIVEHIGGAGGMTSSKRVADAQ